MISLSYGFCFCFSPFDYPNSFVDFLDRLNPLFPFSFSGSEFIDSISGILVLTFMCYH